MSWREFRFNLRPIALLAVGCVVFTTIAIACASHWLLGFTWPVGFWLGAIVSQPDSVAPLSIARRMQVSMRVLVILEGEGLANDATALILYRFAVAAVSVGVFSFPQAVGTFAATRTVSFSPASSSCCLYLGCAFDSCVARKSQHYGFPSECQGGDHTARIRDTACYGDWKWRYRIHDSRHQRHGGDITLD
jgi:sodium/hydrogen exchanger family protein